MNIVWHDDPHVEWLEMPTDRADYYEILEVSPRASDEVIKRAYRALAARYHPDVAAPERRVWAEEMMKLLNVAYETLSDPRKRINYDRERAEPNSRR
jgi:DnaJ-class molecular chaperone